VSKAIRREPSAPSSVNWKADDEALQVNCLGLEHYGYDESDPTKQYWKQSQSVWFDDIVVARQYVGPIVKKQTN
jgi:hypothetical protein